MFTSWVTNVNWDDHTFEEEPTRLWYDDSRFSTVTFGFQDLISKRASGQVSIFLHVSSTDLNESGPEINAVTVSPHMVQRHVERGKNLEIKLFQEITKAEFDAAEYGVHSYSDCYKLDSNVDVFD